MGYTPMIQQYLQIKKDYEDAFLFFRLGDFYEMFFQDAIQASKELEITLTSRDGGGEERIPMCGVPYHSAPNYIDQLIRKGKKVAICEQVEDPRQAKGVVKREVVQLITPGTLMDSHTLEDKENNYMVSITPFDERYGFTYCDLSTGELKLTMFETVEDCFSECALIGAKEVVVPQNFKDQWTDTLQNRYGVTISVQEKDDDTASFPQLLKNLTHPEEISTVTRILSYLHRTQKRNLDHLQAAEIYQTQHYLKMDEYSKRNLELTETIRTKDKKGSLLWLLDETATAMGGRLLKTWIDRPLTSEREIEERVNFVEILKGRFFERQDLREKLQKVYDLERLAGRIAFGNVNGRDFIQLKNSLSQIPDIKNIVLGLLSTSTKWDDYLDACEEVYELLDKAIQENPPISVKEGGLIKDGYHEKLDQYREASRNGKTWIAELEQEERRKTGIKSLKVGYNRVFGYYIEVTKANLHLLKEGQYDRKQTLTNAERFITPDLKEKEALILEAEEKSVELEYDLFVGIREEIKQYIPRLQALAKAISEIDVLQSFATISEERHFVRPTFSKDRKLVIQNGRHAVVEKVLGMQTYVPNDCYMDAERELLLITGPNMAGKSTYMRQVALTAIMAQIGCFVPADQAALPIFDQIFTRIGAADDLVSGQSTFMVEMLEAKNALTKATQNSLILFDEIGRGTSTYDGMSLAQAMIEYVHNEIGAKTLFSTHYHELTVLANELPRLKNIHVSVSEENGKVVFLHKLKEGAADKSYGIHVAELAELPREVIQRAQEILATFENKEDTPVKAESQVKEMTSQDEQLSFFVEEKSEPLQEKGLKKHSELVEELEKLELMEMTPMDAMNALYKLQKLLK
ncbi:DNA mismatch repair protein MutS [Bacillus carboniphilus]|uniref:DNA mismatch repair protein MutS n=1 Tax=Bacillus carboniphilus TaxID=86663 RepID=A0ABN0WIZ0_9BACI